MTLGRRLLQLELRIKLNSKQPGCDITLFIVMPEGPHDTPFDYASYRPNEDEIEKYLKYLKDSGQCRDCVGSCAIDWAAEGFMNHTLTGERRSSSPEPNILTMFCADAEIPVLTRRIMNGERTQLETPLIRIRV